MTTTRPPSKPWRVVIFRFRYQGTAECENCDQLAPDSTRARCRAHVQQTGHHVRYLVEHSTKYEPAKEAGQ